MATLPSPETPLSIILVEPLAVVRAGLTMLISSQRDLTVAAQATSASDAIRAVQSLTRRTNALALISLALLGDHDAFWLMRTLRETTGVLPILAMGVGPDEAQVSEALFYGADGFVHKRVEPPEFVDAIRKTAAGEFVLAGVDWEGVQAIAAVLHLRRTASSPSLTPRQQQILSLAAEGHTARQIAASLGLRERTVTTHLSRIYGKLQVRNRTSAIAAAARQGVVRLAAEG